MLRLASIAVAALVASIETPALAEEDCDGLTVDHTVGLGFLMPSPGCKVTIHGEVGFGLGETYSSRIRREEDPLDVRLFASLGLLFALERAEGLELGPVVAVSAVNDPISGEVTRTELAGLFHSRWWFAGDVLTLEGAGGPSITWDGPRQRPGILLSFGPSVMGVLGVQVVYDRVFWPDEHRIMGGLNLSWGAAMAVLCVASTKCF